MGMVRGSFWPTNWLSRQALPPKELLHHSVRAESANTADVEMADVAKETIDAGPE